MKKTLIIGGGLAGLCAAYELSKSEQYAITIIEASDRLGGRIENLKINQTSIELGGFIVFPWYKNFRDLLNELKLMDILKPMTNGQSYWYLKERYLADKDLKISKINIIHMIVKSLYYIFRFQNSFYNLKQGHTSLKKFLSEFSSTDDLIPFLETYFEGFTYPSTKNISARSALSVLAMMLFKGEVMKSDYLSDSSILINKFEEVLKERGVKIKLNEKVLNIKENIVSTDKNNYSTERIILATYNLPSFFKNNNIRINSTHTYSVVVKMDKDVLINGNTWSSIFFHPKSSEQLASAVAMNWLNNLFDKTYILLYFKTLDNKDLNENNINALIKREVSKYFSDYEINDILISKFWPNNMPYFTEESKKNLINLENKGNIYLAGDYLGFPSMENAIYSSKKLIKGFGGK